MNRVVDPSLLPDNQCVYALNCTLESGTIVSAKEPGAPIAGSAGSGLFFTEEGLLLSDNDPLHAVRWSKFLLSSTDNGAYPQMRLIEENELGQREDLGVPTGPYGISLSLKKLYAVKLEDGPGGKVDVPYDRKVVVRTQKMRFTSSENLNHVRVGDMILTTKHFTAADGLIFVMALNPQIGIVVGLPDEVPYDAGEYSIELTVSANWHSDSVDAPEGSAIITVTHQIPRNDVLNATYLNFSSDAPGGLIYVQARAALERWVQGEETPPGVTMILEEVSDLRTEFEGRIYEVEEIIESDDLQEHERSLMLIEDVTGESRKISPFSLVTQVSGVVDQPRSYVALGIAAANIDSYNEPLLPGKYRYAVTTVDTHGRESAPFPPGESADAPSIEISAPPSAITTLTLQYYATALQMDEGSTRVTSPNFATQEEAQNWIAEQEGFLYGIQYRQTEITDEDAAQTYYEPPARILITGYPAPMSTNEKTNIYRTRVDQPGPFYFLTAIEHDENDRYVDTVQDFNLSVIPCLAMNNFPPIQEAQDDTSNIDHQRKPATLLTEHMGVFFLVRGNKAYYCKAGQPWYWPTDQAIQLPGNITGLVSAGDLLLLTRTACYRLRGASPDEYALKRLPTEHGCEDDRTIGRVYGMPIWKSTEGICVYRDGAVVNLTDGVLLPSDVQGGAYCSATGDSEYYLFLVQGNEQKYIHVSFRFGTPRVTLGSLGTMFVQAAAYNPQDGRVYISLPLGQVCPLWQGTHDLGTEYKTGRITNGEQTIKKHYIKWSMVAEGDWEVHVHIDGEEDATIKQVSSNGTKERHSFYFPSGSRGKDVQFELKGKGTVHELAYEYKPLRFA